MNFTPDTELMRIFDFTAADLEANRAGRLSEMQKNILVKEIEHQRSLIKKPLIQFPLIGFLMSLVFFTPDNIQRWLSDSAMFTGVLLLNGILLSIYIYRGVAKREGILKADKVEVATEIQLWRQAWYKRRSFMFSNAYWIRTPDLRVPISKQRFGELENYLEQGDKSVSYRLYHPLNSRWLLSLEVANKS